MAAIAANQPLCWHLSNQLAFSTALSDGDGWLIERHVFVFGGRIWQAYPDWETMTAPLIQTVMLLFPSYFVRLLLQAYRIKKATVAEFSSASH